MEHTSQMANGRKSKPERKCGKYSSIYLYIRLGQEVAADVEKRASLSLCVFMKLSVCVCVCLPLEPPPPASCGSCLYLAKQLLAKGQVLCLTCAKPIECTRSMRVLVFVSCWGLKNFMLRCFAAK